jgi:hypothetical protein
VFQEKLEEHLNRYVRTSGMSFNFVKKRTKVLYDPTDLTRETNVYNIDYIPSGATLDEERANRSFFSNLLVSELQLRKLPLFGGLEDRRERLKALLKVEQQLDIIMQAISRGKEGEEAALMLISQAIPCIMHLENRVGEKIITVLLVRATEKCQNGRTIGATFLKNVQDLVNTKILGSETRPKQWKVPLNEKGDSIAKVSLSNAKTRIFIENILQLIDFVFSSPEDNDMKTVWRTMLQDYSDAMSILRKQSEYTDSDIKEFQLIIDNFFAAYVERSGAGKEGVTNYLHMLGSSHISYYMRTHGNLYKYSQQGWESLNEKFKLSFFNHTQRGGNFGREGEESERTYLKSIFMYFQRELLWVSGIAEEHLN